MKILLTGVAGFIGFSLARELIKGGDEIIGLDNINEYYDVRLKYARLAQLGIDDINANSSNLVSSAKYQNLSFIKLDLSDTEAILKFFKEQKFDCVVNLAAQAGVRYSLENPQSYISSNILGFENILEGCRQEAVKNLVFASSSSVYGLNTALPFSESASTQHPISLYAATKKANEMMAHSYAHLFNLPCTGLRFFTVYGPWGRPDMALFKFVKAALNDESIDVYNHGNMKRDFTYISDIVGGIIKCIQKPAAPSTNFNAQNPNPAISSAPYRIYNIGKGQSVALMEFIVAIEDILGIKIKKNMLAMQAGDVEATWCDTSALERDFGYKAQVGIKQGVSEFIAWYKNYYGI